MCESVSLLAATSNQDGHQREETKTTEMNTGDLDGSPHPTQETLDSSPLPSHSATPFIYYEDDFRHCYDDDSHLQEDDYDGADQPQEEPAEEHAPAPTSSLAAKLAEYARQKIAGVNTSGAVITGPAKLAEYARQKIAGVNTSGVVITGPAKLAEYARQKIAGVNTSGAVITGLSVVGGAVGAYFLWPAAAGVAAAGATMKAPGAAGFFISRAAFVANPQVYFQILRTAGAAAAAAAFAL